MRSLSFSVNRRSRLRLVCGRQVMRLADMRMLRPTVPLGCSTRVLSTMNSRGITASISRSGYCDTAASLMRRSMMLSVISISSASSRCTSRGTEQNERPPIATYMVSTLRGATRFSILRIMRLVNAATSSTLLTAPYRTQSSSCSSSTACTVSTPDGL